VTGSEHGFTGAELESFAFSVSHDLRAPLRAICGFAEILRRRYRDLLDGDGQRYLDNVAAAGARMGALIEDLLLYARTGRGSVRAVPVPLGPVVAELGAGFAERIAACGAELAVREPLATPRGDPTLIRQILSNLVDNALTYRCLQGTPRIELSAVAEEGEVVIRVIDNGIGIAPEDHRRVFEVFQRLHSQDAYPGTGIGLAIVSKAIHTMGGQVDLSSALGSGSTFSVRLPAA
jgi:signal transduction histidine kinase